MPNLQHAKKALRKSKAHFERNKLIRAEIDSMRRKFRKLLEAKKIDEAKAMIPVLQQKLDKAVKTNIMKLNATSRTMSRLAASIAKVTVK